MTDNYTWTSKKYGSGRQYYSLSNGKQNDILVVDYYPDNKKSVWDTTKPESETNPTYIPDPYIEITMTGGVWMKEMQDDDSPYRREMLQAVSKLADKLDVTHVKECRRVGNMANQDDALVRCVKTDNGFEVVDISKYSGVIDHDLNINTNNLRELQDGLKVNGSLCLEGTSLKELPNLQADSISISNDPTINDFSKASSASLSVFDCMGVTEWKDTDNYKSVSLDYCRNLETLPLVNTPDISLNNDDNLVIQPGTLFKGDLFIQCSNMDKIPENIIVQGRLSTYKSSIERLPDSLQVGESIYAGGELKSIPAHLADKVSNKENLEDIEIRKVAENTDDMMRFDNGWKIINKGGSARSNVEFALIDKKEVERATIIYNKNNDTVFGIEGKEGNGVSNKYSNMIGSFIAELKPKYIINSVHGLASDGKLYLDSRSIKEASKNGTRFDSVKLDINYAVDENGKLYSGRHEIMSIPDGVPLKQADISDMIGANKIDIKEWNHDVSGVFMAENNGLEKINPNVKFGGDVIIEGCKNIREWNHDVPGNFVAGKSGLEKIGENVKFGGDVRIMGCKNIREWNHSVAGYLNALESGLTKIGPDVEFGGDVYIGATNIKEWNNDVAGDFIASKMFVGDNCLEKIGPDVKIGGKVDISGTPLERAQKLQAEQEQEQEPAQRMR